MVATLANSISSGWAEQHGPRPRNMHSNRTTKTHNIEDIDSACLRALVEGDRDAFAQIVDRWQTRLINFFYRSTGNRADAEDLAQETFIELNRVAARYQPQGTFRAFVFTLARRRLIDGYRKKARRPLDYVDPGEYFMQSQAESSDQVQGNRRSLPLRSSRPTRKSTQRHSYASAARPQLRRDRPSARC